MADRARDAQRFIRRQWLLSIAASILLAIGGGLWAYHLSEPFYQDVRQRRVITKTDLDALKASVLTNAQGLGDRVSRIESTRPVTADEIQLLREELERKIQELRDAVTRNR